jgi:hypothetical protein
MKGRVWKWKVKITNTKGKIFKASQQQGILMQGIFLFPYQCILGLISINLMTPRNFTQFEVLIQTAFSFDFG